MLQNILSTPHRQKSQSRKNIRTLCISAHIYSKCYFSQSIFVFNMLLIIMHHGNYSNLFTIYGHFQSAIGCHIFRIFYHWLFQLSKSSFSETIYFNIWRKQHMISYMLGLIIKIKFLRYLSVYYLNTSLSKDIRLDTYAKNEINLSFFHSLS